MKNPAWRVVVGVLLGTLVASGSAVAADDAEKAAAFNDGKALGASKTAADAAKIRSGATATLTPSYDPNLPQKSLYGAGDMASKAANTRASCAATPSDPACAGLNLGTTAQPTPHIPADSPALAGQSAVAHPEAVLGDISSTYTTCTAGPPVQLQPATYSTQTCTLAVTTWTSATCIKSPEQVSSGCTPGSVIASGMKSMSTEISVATLEASATCGDPASGQQQYSVHVTDEDDGVDKTIALSLPLDLPTQSKQVVRIVLPGDELGYQTLTVVADGPACSGGTSCQMTFQMILRQQCRKFGCQVSGHPVGTATVTLNYTRPGTKTVQPARNDCAPYEALTPQLPGDGQATPGNPLMPVVGDAGQRRCVKTAATCTTTDAKSGACLSWLNTFQCANVDAASNCQDLAAKGCTPAKDASCSELDEQGRCLAASQDYKCKLSDAVYAPASNCGASTFCANGSCWDTTYQPNTNMAPAVAHLQARMDAAKDLDPASLKVFNGKSQFCSNHDFGTHNCCNTGGGLLSCDQGEKETAAKKEKGVCHLVGDFCSHRVPLLGCATRQYQYCCYSGILARVIQEQGRSQVNKSWGSPNSPDCSGFTVDQFASLNWDAIDLSEWYSQINPVPPDMGQAQKNGQAKQSNCYYGSGNC